MVCELWELQSIVTKLDQMAPGWGRGGGVCENGNVPCGSNITVTCLHTISPGHI